jgi:lipopolysaccharide transport system permease protein
MTIESLPAGNATSAPAARSTTRRGFDDLAQGLLNWRLWHLMGIGVLRRRYSRSKLGQFWTTITMAVMVTVMGLTWAILWRVPVAEILPYIAGSLVLWTFFTGVIGEATTVMSTSGNYFLNQNINFSIPIYAIIYNHLITLLHNSVIVVIVLVLFPRNPGWNVLLFIPGFILTLITLTWVSCAVAILCARYRDVVQLIASILQTAFYVTPVLYRPDFVPADYQWINLINPFAIFLSITRDPLFGLPMHWETWLIASVIAIGGALWTLRFVGTFCKRVIYWI